MIQNSGYIIAGRIPVCAACDGELKIRPEGKGRPKDALPIKGTAEFPESFVCVMCKGVFYGTRPILLGEIRQ